MNITPEEWFRHSHHLGNSSPYYTQKEPGRFHSSIESALASLPAEKRIFDSVGAIEILSKGYLFGNRTLVKGLRRSPWMARPAREGGWEYADVPPHGTRRVPMETLLRQVKEALRQEMLSYLEDRKQIGVLLSGGMDSRILAGILRELELTGDFNGRIVAFTWGLEESRDVVYAKEIARRCHWEWIHLPVGPDSLKENIRLTGEMGAESAPFHLHGMSQVARFEGLDAVLAGSYGDSVGRAEFSGRRLRELPPFIGDNLNRFGLLKTSAVRNGRERVKEDVFSYRKNVQREAEYQYREIEQQLHYMRRLLQGAMGAIAKEIPLCQLFTAPSTFGLMWSLDPDLRNDRLYAAILPTLPEKLDEIPWARTGKPYNDPDAQPDAHLKNHHMYGLWLRRDLRDFIAPLAGSERIRELGIFNEKALDVLLKIWPLPRTKTVNALDEAVSWLASLAVFLETYSIQPSTPPPAKSPAADLWQGSRGVANACRYLAARELLRS